MKLDTAITNAKQMISGTYMIDAREQQIKSVEVTESCVKITTDRKVYNVGFKNLGSWITEALPVHPPVKKRKAKNDEDHDADAVTEQKSEQTMAIIRSQNSDIQSLKDTLMDNIEKVKGDAGYVKQASEVTKSVNAVLDIARLQITLVKEMNKAR